MPKNKHIVWRNFECLKTKNTGNWARCKSCVKEMQGIPSRMEKHLKMCRNASASPETAIDERLPSTSSGGAQSTVIHTPGGKPQKTLATVKDCNIISTSKDYAANIDLQIARYFYATNTSFNHADHSEFKEMCSLLRPGYKSPSAYQIGNPLLSNVHRKMLEECKEKLKGETVCMSLDGWSNIHNDAIVCCSIVTAKGDSILVDSIDTGINPHTAINLKDIALKAIKRAEEDFQVHVKSIVTDNAANVQKMSSYVSEEIDILQYGCSAHYLNLLAQDIEIPAATEAIIKVIKYFRNRHVPSALYKQSQGNKLVMPVEVRWNTMNDAIISYLDNRGILVQICQDNKDAIDNDIIKIVNDSHVTMNAVDLMARTTPVAIALDRMQRTTTTIAVAVEIWNKLEVDLKSQPLSVKKHFHRRRSMALSGVHFAANMIDHRFLGERLSNVQREDGYKFINDIYSGFLPFILALTSKSAPFPKYMFGVHFRNTPPLVWWKSIIMDENQWPGNKAKFLELGEQLLTAHAVTAALERYFSSFGLIQSTLRNRLGNEKAAKLVFLFKYLNQSAETKQENLKWLWDMQDAVVENVATESLIQSSSSDDEPLINN